MTAERKKAVFNWSGGKDSALALLSVLHAGEYEVVALLTTINQAEQRSSMHGIPVALLEKQASRIGIPLHIVELMPSEEMEGYENAMRRAAEHFLQTGAVNFIFGDIFLHDVKSYREEKLRPLGITVVEPLWGKSSPEIMAEFIASGLKTIVVTTTADILDSRYIGKIIDEKFLQDLPSGVDVCGENGEYHTFCYDGPLFKKPVEFTLGEPLQKTFPIKLSDGTTKEFSYWFANLQDSTASDF